MKNIALLMAENLISEYRAIYTVESFLTHPGTLKLINKLINEYEEGDKVALSAIRDLITEHGQKIIWFKANTSKYITPDDTEHTQTTLHGITSWDYQKPTNLFNGGQVCGLISNFLLCIKHFNQFSLSTDGVATIHSDNFETYRDVWYIQKIIGLRKPDENGSTE